MSYQPQRISSYINQTFAQNGIKRAIKRAEIVILWPKVVGEDVARFSSAKSFKEGTLLVEVSDNETATHLTLQRQHFLRSYKENFAIEIKDIRFRVGVLTASLPKQASQNPIVIDEQELSKLTQHISELDLSKDLTKVIFNLAQAFLRQKAERRALGWQPCEICEVLKAPKEKFCLHCQRLSASDAVKEGSQKLAVNPEVNLPYLNKDSLPVARHLAKKRLLEQMQELLPFALADPNNLGQLEQATHCYLAHQLNKPLQEVVKNDYAHLPSNIARVLGYLG